MLKNDAKNLSLHPPLSPMWRACGYWFSVPHLLWL